MIPTYNNASTIADVVKRTMVQCYDVIVVNDGSTDSTSDILKGIDGITVVSHNGNKGKGCALKTGFRCALERGFSYAITLDADGQHYPEDIHLFLESNIRTPGAIILGERNLQGADRSSGSKFANSFSNFWFCFQTLHYMPDTQTGFRLYPLHRLYGMNLITSRYEAELELLVWSSWCGTKMVSQPVNVYYPPRKERVSHFKPAKDFLRISMFNTIFSILAILCGWPLAIFRVLSRAVDTFIALFVYLTCALLIVTPFSLCCVLLSKVVKWDFGNTIRRTLHFFGSFVVKILPCIGVKSSIVNENHENFSKPALIICNHQSHLDLMLHLSMTSKIVFLTNDWVWKSPFFGFVIRHAEYYPVSAGLDTLLPGLKSLAERGYSIAVYPEGTRSSDGKIGRFHKGAFHIAEQLGIDILPLTLYGANRVLPKGGKYMRRGRMILEIGKRITVPEQKKMAESLLERTKKFRQLYINSYNIICNKYDRNA